MRRLVAFAVVLFSIAPLRAEPLSDSDAKRHQDELQGTWKPLSMAYDGADLEDMSEFTIEFTDNVFSADVSGIVTKCHYTIDSEARPREIDLSVEFGGFMLHYQGIYEVDGDALKLCIARQDKQRPTEFQTLEGDKRKLTVFQRVK